MGYEKTQDEEKLIQSTELITCTVAQSRMTEHTFHPSCALGMAAPSWGNLHRFHSCILKLPSLLPTVLLFRATVVESWSYEELSRKQIPPHLTYPRHFVWNSVCSIWQGETLRVKGLPSPNTAAEWQLIGTTWRLISFIFRCSAVMLSKYMDLRHYRISSSEKAMLW